MSRTTTCLLALAVLAGPILVAQERVILDPAALRKPLADDWTSYSGDYTGRRFSALTEINQSTVKGLSLAWVSRLTAGLPGGGGGRGGGRGGGGGAPGNVIIGGEGAEEFAFSGAPTVKGSILEVNDVL